MAAPVQERIFWNTKMSLNWLIRYEIRPAISKAACGRYSATMCSWLGSAQPCPMRRLFRVIGL